MIVDGSIGVRGGAAEVVFAVAVKACGVSSGAVVVAVTLVSGSEEVTLPVGGAVAETDEASFSAGLAVMIGVGLPGG